MTRLAIRSLSTAVITACTALSSFAAWAADAPAAPATTASPAVEAPLSKSPIAVEIKIIHAQKHGKFIDQRVRSIEKLLKPVFNFANYRLVKEEKLNLSFGSETRVPMPFRVAVRITQQGTRARKISLGVRIGRKQTVKLLLEDGGTFLQGVTLKNGQNYILAISASSTK